LNAQTENRYWQNLGGRNEKVLMATRWITVAAGKITKHHHDDEDECANPNYRHCVIADQPTSRFIESTHQEKRPPA
jgi:hypothetical protein